MKFPRISSPSCTSGDCLSKFAFFRGKSIKYGSDGKCLPSLTVSPGQKQGQTYWG